MKTTVELSDDLLRRIKATAATRGQSLDDFVTEALEEQLERTGTASDWAQSRCSVPSGARREEVELIDDAVPPGLEERHLSVRQPKPVRRAGAPPRLYSYIVTHDSGFSPNPFWGVCTLADCKPKIRQTAVAGDWIVGLSPKAKGHRVVYAMKVDEILDYARYFTDPRFTAKIPDFSRRGTIYWRDDNIYEPLPNGQYRQLRSQHSNPDGTEDLRRKATDLSGRNVLIGTQFSYFGAHRPPLPDSLDDLIVGRAHKCKFSQEVVARFLEFVGSQPRGVLAPPAIWPRHDDSWRQGRQ